MNEEPIVPDLAYLLGALRDGSVYYNKASRDYVTAFYQRSRTWLEESVASRIFRLFRVECMIDEYKSGHWRVRVYSKRLYKIWREELGFPEEGKTQASRNTPKRIMTASRDTKRAYVRGFFDAEGDISPEISKSPYVGFSQKNEQVLKDLNKILKEFSIDTGNIHTIDARSNTRRFVIGSKKDIAQFITIIDSEHPRKKNALRELDTYYRQHT